MRAAKESRLAGTLLFSGPSGIGKKHAALALAQAVVCEKGVEGACGECGSCLRIEKGQSESLLQISPDGAQIKIEQARDALQFIGLRTLGRGRAIIIDQAHLLGPQAANALLKSLEEPPAATHFILVTPLAAAVLPTIRSRSQLVRFKPLSDSDLAKILGDQADEWVIEAARGSVEAARALLDSRDDFAQLEQATLQYMASAMVAFPSQEISDLRERLRDRTAHSFVSGVIQGTVRDALRARSGLKARSKGAASDIAKSLAQKNVNQLDSLAAKAVEFEFDLGRNVDRGLILETFAIELGRG